MRRLLTPPDHRLPLIAAGAVPWALAFALVDVRLGGTWSPWVLTVALALAAALPLALGLAAEPRRPVEAPVAVLVFAGLAVALFAIGRLTDALGAPGAFGTAAATCLGAIAFATTAESARRFQPIPVLVLVVALTVGVAVVAFVQWAFSPGEPGTFRWVLLALMLGYLVAHAQVRERAPREGVLLMDAVGLAAVGLGVLVAFDGSAGVAGVISGSGGSAGWGWQLALLLVGIGLAAFAAVEREGGPGLLALIVLAGFVTIAGVHDSLLWWPLILLLGGALAIGIGLRPARPLPPEPTPPGGPGETVPMPER